MARSIQVIQNQIIDEKNAQTALASMNSTSQAARWRLWTFIQAVAINLFEQVQDIFKTEIETIVSTAAPGTPQWIQDQVFKFQYDATTPQVLELDTTTFSFKYPIINTALRIVTRCSVKTDPNKVVNVKVAKSEPPVPLATLEANDLKSYLDVIDNAGVQINLINLVADKLFCEADIYYNGQFASVIQANVIAALKNYLATLPFDGIVKVSAIEDTIQSVQGVVDVVLKNVRARDDNTPLGSATYLVQSNQTLVRLWQTVAGYIVEENTAGNTFADKLNFIAT